MIADKRGMSLQIFTVSRFVRFCRRRRIPKYYLRERLTACFAPVTKARHGRGSVPPGSREIHEVESLAVDPANPDIVYAGTWHLPWKTTDGGKNWHNIKQGMIDDSDVFSIILDPEKPSTIFLSACSGIYKS